MLQEIAVDRDGNVVKISEVTSALRSWTDRADFADRGWTCPVCGGPMSVKFGNKGSVERGKETHFFHSAPYPGSDHEPESEIHASAKLRFVREISASLASEFAAWRIASFEGPRTEERLADGESRADVYFSTTFPDGSVRRYVVEAQYSPISPEEFARRHGNYYAEGITDFWAFGPDFMKPTSTGKLRPAAVLETVFLVFWHATVIRPDGYTDFFPPPPYGDFVWGSWEFSYERGSWKFLYWGPPALPERFSMSSKKAVDLTYETPERIVDMMCCRPLRDELFSADFRKAEFSRRVGVSTPQSRISEASKTRMEEIEEEAAECERAEKAASEAASAIASSEGQVFATMALWILAALMERSFREFYAPKTYGFRKYSSSASFVAALKRFYGPFDTRKDWTSLSFGKTSDALLHFLRRLAHVRKSNGPAWDFYGMDSYLDAYVGCFRNFSESAASYSSTPKTRSETARQAREMFGVDHSDARSGFPSGFADVPRFYCGNVRWEDDGEAAILLTDSGFSRAFKRVTWHGWEDAVLALATNPQWRRAAAEHVRDVIRIFTGSREYDHENFLLKTEDESI